MTLANTNALPYIRVIFTGRDLVISKVVLFNKDTKQDLSITDSSEWSIIGNNININLVNHISFLSKIKNSSTLSIAMYDSNNIPIYKDIIMFYDNINGEQNYTFVETEENYTYIENE